MRQAYGVGSVNCQLCVRAGRCAPDSLDPAFRGTLLHRIWTCPVLEDFRHQYAPQDWLNEVQTKMRVGGMTAADLSLYTRAIMPSPAPSVDRAPTESTFEWILQPVDLVVCDVAYTDASRLDAEPDLYGLCARQGWAFACFDAERRLVAAAHGRPPGWARGIHAAELWALLMGAQTAGPHCPLRIDCQSIQQGS